MNKKVIGIAIAVMFVCGSVFTMCGMCQTADKTFGNAKEAAMKVNNTICPVSGDKVNMDNPATVEYKGEIYNLCCPLCAPEFNKDPEKYSKKAKEQK